MAPRQGLQAPSPDCSQISGEFSVSIRFRLVRSPLRPLLRHLRPLQLLALCSACAAALTTLADACGALGLWPAAVLGGLLLWALLGEQLPGSGANLRYVGVLLALGATLRAARLYRAALGMECYAAATFAGQRRRDWSPRGHVLMCALSTQSDALMQRSLGYGLGNG
jgi:hypothetical protein